jgi:putative ABC transport system permease protein
MLGRGIMGLYADLFRFPRFDYHLDPQLALIALGLAIITVVAGTLVAIQATVRLSPAQAMRPPAPGHYRRALIERLRWLRLAPSLRMILRNLERRPLRAVITSPSL